MMISPFAGSFLPVGVQPGSCSYRGKDLFVSLRLLVSLLPSTASPAAGRAQLARFVRLVVGTAHVREFRWSRRNADHSWTGHMS